MGASFAEGFEKKLVDVGEKGGPSASSSFVGK